MYADVERERERGKGSRSIRGDRERHREGNLFTLAQDLATRNPKIAVNWRMLDIACEVKRSCTVSTALRTGAVEGPGNFVLGAGRADRVI